MTLTREMVMIALENLFNGANTPFQTVSRKFKLWNDVGKEQRPALFMLQTGEMSSGGERNITSLTVIEVRLFIYTWAKEAKLPAAILNPLVDFVDQSLKGSQLSGKQTLGNLVDHVWREGNSLFVAGDLEGAADAELGVLQTCEPVP